MGNSCTNLHVRAESRVEVTRRLNGLISQPAAISEPENRWVSIYPQETERMEDSVLQKIARNLSSDLSAHAIAIMLYDSDVFLYWLFDKGELIDSFNSAPEYFEDDSEEMDADERAKLVGQPNVLASLPGVSAMSDEFQAILHPEFNPVFADDIVSKFTALLGLSETKGVVGFRDVAEDDSGIADFDAQVVNADGSIERAKEPASKPTNATQPSAFPDFSDYLSGAVAIDEPLNSSDSMLGFVVGMADLDKVQKLLSAGADPNFRATAPDHRGYAAGRTPLMMACVGIILADSVVRVVETLLDAGADPALKDNAGLTALDYIAKTRADWEAKKLAPIPTNPNIRPEHAEMYERALANAKLNFTLTFDKAIDRCNQIEEWLKVYVS